MEIEPLIAVVDYGMGNLRSVSHALRRAGARVKLAATPGEMEDAAGAVLPGVGAFAAGMRNLKERSMVEPVRETARSRPLLAICLGMQLLFDESEEGGEEQGLGILPGRVVRLSENVRIPQMGWNTISRAKATEGSVYGPALPEGEHFYFAHSYCVQADDDADVIATTEYGFGFASAVGRDLLLGVQFHPEKSAKAGLEILRRFVAIARKGEECSQSA